MQREYIYNSFRQSDKCIELMCETISRPGQGAVVVFVKVKNTLDEIVSIIEGSKIIIETKRKISMVIFPE